MMTVMHGVYAVKVSRCSAYEHVPYLSALEMSNNQYKCRVSIGVGRAFSRVCLPVG